MLKQGDIIEYTATGYATAETVGNVDGYTVFVPFLIVGERARVRVNYVKNSVAYADVVELLDSSPCRVTPPCKYYGTCGGCSVMHMNYQEQLVFKHNKVATNLAKLGGITVDVLPCVPSPLTVGYRNKLSLPVGGKTGNVTIGMYKKNSHIVVDCTTCLLGGSWAEIVTRECKKYLDANRIVPYNERYFTGEVRHVVARFVDDQLLVTLVSNGKFNHDLTELYNSLKLHFGKVGLFVNENTLHNNVILGKNTIHVCGITSIQTQHFGVRFELQPTSFFQVNNQVKDLIYAKAKQLLDVSSTQVLVDCFSGIGVLTGAMCSNKYHTYAVEIEQSSSQDADKMKQLNNIANLTNICGDVAVELPKIVADNKGKVMSLIVDPPRKGLGESVCNTVVEAEFGNVVYISCDSATLARDLKQLAPYYNVIYCQPYDMFPNTDQVETLVLLQRKLRVAVDKA